MMRHLDQNINFRALIIRHPRLVIIFFFSDTLIRTCTVFRFSIGQSWDCPVSIQLHVHCAIYNLFMLLFAVVTSDSLPYSRKVWWAINLANWLSVVIGQNLNLANWILSTIGAHANFPIFTKLTNLKTSPKFPAIRYKINCHNYYTWHGHRTNN